MTRHTAGPELGHVGSKVREPVPRYRPAERYRAILRRRTADERGRLAHIKRLLERHRADPRFRAELAASGADQRRVAAAYGVTIDLREVLPLIDGNYARDRDTVGGDRWPAVGAWDAYLSDLRQLPAAFREAGNCPDTNPRFDAWRERQIRRTQSELGALSGHILHPILAFELSAGCSVGCWFCGVSAGKFRSNFTYTRGNARLWRALLEQATELFGGAAQTGFCYWASDPSDNPDYTKFIEDYHLVTGALPQTTTAAPLKDLALTRRIMQLHDEHGCMPNRFSILNLKALDRVHATFTPEELLGVDLVLQNREAMVPKAFAGRARRDGNKYRAQGNAGSGEVDGATIACVSGFLVNMVERTIRLISPTRTGESSPLGYRTFGGGDFKTALEFRRTIEDLIAQHMPATVAGAPRLSFRDDLVYRREPDGFTLQSPGGRVALSGFEGAGLLGDILSRGDSCAGDLQAELASAGLDIFVVAEILQQLFDRGLIAEVSGAVR